MQKTLFITIKGAKRLKKHSNVDYGAAKLIETEKGLIRLVDNCLMKLEPLGKGPRVLQKVFKSELDNLYQKQCLCPWDKNINAEMYYAGEKLAIFHSIGQGNPKITSTINDIVNSMGHHDNIMKFLDFKDLYLKALQFCGNTSKEIRRVVLEDKKVEKMHNLQDGLDKLREFWNPKREQ